MIEGNCTPLLSSFFFFVCGGELYRYSLRINGLKYICHPTFSNSDTCWCPLARYKHNFHCFDQYTTWYIWSSITDRKQEKVLHLSYLPALMIPPKNCDPISITNFQSHQKCDSLHWVVPTICIDVTKRIRKASISIKWKLQTGITNLQLTSHRVY